MWTRVWKKGAGLVARAPAFGPEPMVTVSAFGMSSRVEVRIAEEYTRPVSTHENARMPYLRRLAMVIRRTGEV